MTWAIRFPAPLLGDLRKRLFADSPQESGAILICNAGANKQLLVDRVHFPKNDEISAQSPTALEFSPLFVSRAVKEARTHHQSTIFVHTHPFATWPRFSATDDAGEARLLPLLQNRVPARPHGFLVLGTDGFEGRIHLEGGDHEEITRLIEVGADVRIESISSGASSSTERLELFDRAIRAFGAEGQSKLENSRIGIVGVGGTGSIVAEQLAHLGVGEIRLLDDDSVEESNLNRVVGAGIDDVGRPKVDVAADYISGIGHKGLKILPLTANVLDEVGIRHVLDCDFIFCCTDSHGSRAALVQASYQFLVPMIDLGIQIDVADHAIRAMSGRVQMMAPGLACLQCRSLLDSETVRRDFMTEEQRASDRYITGVHIHQPAVISLNGTVASLAVTMFLSAMVGLPARARSQIYRIAEGIIKPTTTIPMPECVVCSSQGSLAKGESWPLLTR